MKSLLRVLPLALCLALPAFSDDGKTDPPKKDEGKKTEAQDADEVKKTISAGIKLLDEKSYSFTAKLDLEMGGSPMLNTELKAGACPESLCLERPAALESLARRYVDAGSEIVHTNTFGASPLKLSMRASDAT